MATSLPTTAIVINNVGDTVITTYPAMRMIDFFQVVFDNEIERINEARKQFENIVMQSSKTIEIELNKLREIICDSSSKKSQSSHNVESKEQAKEKEPVINNNKKLRPTDKKEKGKRNQVN